MAGNTSRESIFPKGSLVLLGYILFPTALNGLARSYFCKNNKAMLTAKKSHTEQFKSTSFLTLLACRVCDHQRRRNRVTCVIELTHRNHINLSGKWFNQIRAISSVNEPSATLTSIVVCNSEHISHCINTILPWISTKCVYWINNFKKKSYYARLLYWS